jgi:hypothetical protein
MDETKIALPPWLPWATTACLAALVACFGELWIIERTRSHLMRDEILLNEASLQAAQNQLEAERIVSRREIGQLRSGSAPDTVAILGAPATGDPFAAGNPWGIVVWRAGNMDARIRFLGLAATRSDRDLQLWVEDSSGGEIAHRGMPPASREGEVFLDLHFVSPVPAGYRILLIDGKKGGAATLGEAKAEGSIVLATVPRPGKISN